MARTSGWQMVLSGGWVGHGSPLSSQLWFKKTSYLPIVWFLSLDKTASSSMEARVGDTSGQHSAALQVDVAYVPHPPSSLLWHRSPWPLLMWREIFFRELCTSWRLLAALKLGVCLQFCTVNGSFCFSVQAHSWSYWHCNTVLLIIGFWSLPTQSIPHTSSHRPSFFLNVLLKLSSCLFLSPLSLSLYLFPILSLRPSLPPFS